MRLLGRILFVGTLGALLLVDQGSCQLQPTSTTSTTPSTPSSNSSTSSTMLSSTTSFNSNSSALGALSFTTNPINQTATGMSSVMLNVQLSGQYTGRLAWMVDRQGSTLGTWIYDSAIGNNVPSFPQTNYELVEYSLNIVNATWKDGGTYTVLLSDANRIHTSATVVVIDSVVASVTPSLTSNSTMAMTANSTMMNSTMTANPTMTNASAMTMNTMMNLTCTVTYGAPDTWDSPQIQLDRTPRLQMKLGDKIDLTNLSTPQITPGVAGVRPTVITQTVMYTITQQDIKDRVALGCTVQTNNPMYLQTSYAAVKRNKSGDASGRFNISPRKDEYDTRDIIVCSVRDAYPEAHAMWEPKNSPGYHMVERPVPDQLIVDEDLIPGQHTWTCYAIDMNNHTIDEYDFTFNVSGHGSGWWQDQEAERQKKIGLGVGLGLGLFFLILLIIIIIYCAVSRRQGKGRPPSVSKSKSPPSATTTDGYRPLDNPGSAYTPSQQVPPPIYQPKVSTSPGVRGAGSPAPSDQNNVPLLDRSGHGDLGGPGFRPTSPAARSSTSTVASSRPNGDAGSNAGFADLGPVAGPPSANRSMLSHNTSVISSNASSIVDPAMQQSSRPISNRTYMGGGPRDSGRDQLVPPTSGHATGV